VPPLTACGPLALTKERCYSDGVAGLRRRNVLRRFLRMVGALREPADFGGPVAVFLHVQKAGLASIDSLLVQDLRRPCLVEVRDADEEVSLVLIFESDCDQS